MKPLRKPIEPLTFVITGAARGIGLELTRQALEAGHTVYAAAREPRGVKAFDALRAKFAERLRIVQCDVTDDARVRALAEELGRPQPVDVLINNAGIMVEYGKGVTALSIDALRDSFEVNTIAAVRVIQALYGNLTASRQPKIVNMTSLMGSIADNRGGKAVAYRMSKTALNMFTKTLAIDEPALISIVMHPGWVQTDMGGAEAPTSVETSAAGILTVVGKLTAEDSGRFLNFKGEELPW